MALGQSKHFYLIIINFYCLISRFFLDISSRTASVRLDLMEKEKEIYEEESKIKKIEKIYEWLVGEFPAEFVTVNGEQPIEKVTDELLRHIEMCKNT